MEEPKAQPLTPDGLRRFATKIGMDADAFLKSKAPADVKSRVGNRANILQPTFLALANAPEPLASAWVKLLSPEISAFYMEVADDEGGGVPITIGACRTSSSCIQTTKAACDVIPGQWSPGLC